MKKIAVILFNLGGPDSKEAIEPFLMNFFTDKNIIGAPFPIRWMLAKFISKKRTRNEAGESYALLGGGSPLLKNSQAQGDALETLLNQNTDDKSYKAFICMNYWHPMADEVVRDVQDWGADEVVLLPLYPQFSTTTTNSSLQSWDKACKRAKYHPARHMVCCYPTQVGFLQAASDHIRAAHKQAMEDGHEPPRILFSAHGLPEKIIKGGDPYQWQCEQSAAVIADRVGISHMEWQICYQSRVGPLKWIGPSTEEALAQAAKDGKAVVIFPHAFTQEHVETLVEIEVEYRELAEELGVPGFYRAETVGTHPAFIKGLADLVTAQESCKGITAEGGTRICPAEFGRCCMEN